jgi:tetratricopeptide (TPR) repeat protein
MQAKQYWLPIKEHKQLYANLIVYSVTIVLVLMFHRELMWAQKLLRSHLFSNSIPSSIDRQLISQAVRGAEKGEDVNQVQRLFKQALEIDPYSEARLLLGYCYFRQGEYDKMLACYDQYRLINPSDIDTYKGMLDVLKEKQDSKAVEQLLTEGIQHFRRRVELYKPYYDPNVSEVFNHKAFTVYNNAQEGLKFLEDTQEQLKVHE